MIETKINLNINKNITQEQFNEAVGNGLIGENDLTFISDTNNIGEVPAGGTTGQVLSKVSNTDYDTEWVNKTEGTTNYNNLTNKPLINLNLGAVETSIEGEVLEGEAGVAQLVIEAIPENTTDGVYLLSGTFDSIPFHVICNILTVSPLKVFDFQGSIVSTPLFGIMVCQDGTYAGKFLSLTIPVASQDTVGGAYMYMDNDDTLYIDTTGV